MNDTKIDLEYLAYMANFAHSQREPTSMSSLIKSPRFFFYQWTPNGMEILTFEDSRKPDTAKLFRYNQKQIHSGVDLESDVPAIVGNEVVKVFQEYANR